jgi:hypothetical protein
MPADCFDSHKALCYTGEAAKADQLQLPKRIYASAILQRWRKEVSLSQDLNSKVPECTYSLRTALFVLSRDWSEYRKGES